MAMRSSVEESVEDEDEEEEVTFLALEEGEEVATTVGESATIFDLGEESAMVAKENEENAGAMVTNLMEIRTKLKFVGNHVQLRNPEMVATLVDDIAGQMEGHEGSKFVLCLHVGTTAGADLKTSRPGFIEGRSETLMSALHEHDDELKVGTDTRLNTDVFEHFGTTRFAGLVMKVYGGDVLPECSNDDLVPPGGGAGALLQVTAEAPRKNKRAPPRRKARPRPRPRKRGARPRPRPKKGGNKKVSKGKKDKCYQWWRHPKECPNPNKKKGKKRR